MSEFQIQPVFQLWMILSFAVAFFFALAWKEYQRKIKFRWWRVLATLLMVLSVLGLFLQPSIKTTVSTNGMVVLTPHYKKDVADSLYNANSTLTFVRLEKAVQFRNAKEISPNDLLNSTLEIKFVLGDGLPGFMALDSASHFQFFKSNLPTGIVSWIQPALIKIHQKNKITGAFNANGKSSVQLMGPGGAEDSVSFSKSGLYPFTLSFTPRQAGLFAYSVIIRDSLGISSQKFPVHVENERKLRVFISLHYPTAETRALKNFLIEAGHVVVARTQLSKNNFHYEYGHTSAIRIDRLTSETLKSFDVVIVDQKILEMMSAADRNQLEESIKQGLGSLVLSPSIKKNNSLSFFSIPAKENKSDTVRIKLGASHYTFSMLPVRVDAPEVTSIIRERNAILAGYLNKGAGKIGFQLLQETYRLKLKGNIVEYAELWSPVIEKLARVSEVKSSLQLENNFPIYPDEPLHLNVISSQTPPLLTDDGVLLPLREDVVIDDYWHGNTWANRVGWHLFSIPKDSVNKDYYVSDQAEWQSLRIIQQQKINETVSQKATTNDATLKDKIEIKPISSLFFFLVFLFSSAFLWLAPKL